MTISDNTSSVAPLPPGSNEETPYQDSQSANARGQKKEQDGQNNMDDEIIINLIRVPGIHQVLLKVQVAELNRTRIAGNRGRYSRVSIRTPAISWEPTLPVPRSRRRACWGWGGLGGGGYRFHFAHHDRVWNFPQRQFRDFDSRLAQKPVDVADGGTEFDGHERSKSELSGRRSVSHPRDPSLGGIGQFSDNRMEGFRRALELHPHRTRR